MTSFMSENRKVGQALAAKTCMPKACAPKTGTGPLGSHGLGRLAIRFRRDRSGASALEFALLAAPTILLLLAIMQVGMVYFSNFMLEGAVEQGARLIRTGQAQNGKFTAQEFKTELCKHIFAPLSCGNLKIDVRSYDSFSGADGNLTNPLDADGNLRTNFNYDPGLGEDVVVVRAFYPMDIGSILPAEINLSNMAGGNRLIMATAAFRNEPFK